MNELTYRKEKEIGKKGKKHPSLLYRQAKVRRSVNQEK